MSEELRPCPFCGAEVQDDERGEKYPRKSPMGGWIIHCECCGASLSQFRKSGKGEISWNTRPIEDALNARIAELEAERKEFCPNCEAETPCTHEAELFVCDICGEDFAKYIVSRNCNVSDVSITQDVLTDVKTPRSIENNNPDYYKDDVGKWIPVSERLPEDGQYVAMLDPNPYSDSGWEYCHHVYDRLYSQLPKKAYWMPLPEPPEVENV